jgi:hypothetical protein
MRPGAEWSDVKLWRSLACGREVHALPAAGRVT